MKKLLVLGASIAQIPFITTAKKMGCHIAVVDFNNTAAAIKYADEYFECSLLDVDGIRKIVNEFNPDGITCGTCDVGVKSAAIICEEFGFPGMSVETAQKVTDKGTMIEVFQKMNVPHPKFVVVNECDKLNLNIEFPVITKPVDKSGSRGINIAYTTTELEHALKNSFAISDKKEVIVEEFLVGPEVSVEILVQNGEPFVLQVTDKLTSGAPHFIEIGHSQPSRLSNKDIEKIKSVAYAATKAVGIVNGSAHAEMKVTSNGPKMIEIAGRQGADYITTTLLPISTGINLSEYEILRALGKPKKFVPSSQMSRGVAVRFIEAQYGTIDSIEINYNTKSMLGIEELQLICETGKTYTSIENNNDRFGYIITTGENAKEAVERATSSINCIKIKMK